MYLIIIGQYLCYRQYQKIFETVIYEQLYEHIQVHNILTDSQYSFRKSHSTEYTAIELVDRIMRALDKKKYHLIYI